MYRAHEKLNAVETCTGDETMGQFLPHLLEQLESCQKSLSGLVDLLLSQRNLFNQSQWKLIHASDTSRRSVSFFQDSASYRIRVC